MIQGALRDCVVKLLRGLGTRLHQEGRQLISTIYLHRSVSKPIIDLEMFPEVDQFVDYYVLMNYEFGHSYLHSPIKWAENALGQIVASPVRPEKLIITIPFYGYEYSLEGALAKTAATGFNFLTGKEAPYIAWDMESEEHTATYMKYGERDKNLETVTVIMPTLYVEKLAQSCSS